MCIIGKWVKISIVMICPIKKYRRRDFQHKLSSRLIRENQAIGLENLSVENMLKKRHLSKHIADASWSSFYAIMQQ